MNSENIAEKYTKYYQGRMTDTVLAGLLLAGSIGYEGLILLVLLGIQGNFEGALKRDRSAGSRGGGSK